MFRGEPLPTPVDLINCFLQGKGKLGHTLCHVFCSTPSFLVSTYAHALIIHQYRTVPRDGWHAQQQAHVARASNSCQSPCIISKIPELSNIFVSKYMLSSHMDTAAPEWGLSSSQLSSRRTCVSEITEALMFSSHGWLVRRIYRDLRILLQLFGGMGCGLRERY